MPVCMDGLLGFLLRSAPPNDFEVALIAGSTTSRLLLRQTLTTGLPWRHPYNLRTKTVIHPWPASPLAAVIFWGEVLSGLLEGVVSL